jgi:predicted transporter
MAFAMSMLLYGPITTILGVTLPLWVLIVFVSWMLMQFLQGSGMLEQRQPLPFPLILGNNTPKTMGATVLIIGTIILSLWWFDIIKENDNKEVVKMGGIMVLMMLGVNYLAAHFVNPKLINN